MCLAARLLMKKPPAAVLALCGLARQSRQWVQSSDAAKRLKG
jgi:hypothetical protein